ncbi:MAG: hypothetical protein ACOYN4_04650 [Bacteroidales bacterium]
MYINIDFIRKTLKKRLIKTGWLAPTKTEDDIAVAQYIFKLTIFSTTIFVFAALAFRFLLNLQTSVLLGLHDLHFRYRLFDITFPNIDGSKWPLLQILLVFGLGYVLLTLFGLYLIYKFNTVHNVKWQTRLIYTWVALLLSNSLPAAMVAGCFSGNSFGVIAHWLVENMGIRLLIGFGALLMMFLSRNFWVFLFLKAAPSSYFLTEDEPMALYITHVFAKAWIYGFLILLFFNWPMGDIYWPIFYFCFGFVALPLRDRPTAYEDISIRKSKKEILSSPNAIYYIVGILFFIRIAGTVFSIQI